MRILNITSSFFTKFLLLLVVAPGPANAIEPVIQLSARADRVLVGSVISMDLAGDDGSTDFVIQPIAALKGALPTGPVAVRLAASQLMAQHSQRQVALDTPGYGIWFLGRSIGEGVFDLLPTQKGEYTEFTGAFVPVPPSWTPNPSQSGDQQLLDALAERYYLSGGPDTDYDYSFYVSLEGAQPEDAQAVVRGLIRASNVDQQAVGVTAGLRLGLDEAVRALSDNLDALAQHERFQEIKRALTTYYRPNGPTSISELRHLMELPSEEMGVKLAAVKALAKTESTPETLSIIALAFDSDDPMAIRAASRLFHFYAALAGPGGGVNTSGNGRHPYLTEETRLYSGSDTTISAQEHALFWRNWWQSHRQVVGAQ